MVGMDLRRESLVLTVPPIEQRRYFSIQLTDAYTYNFGYLGSRTTGNGGGSFLVVGPRWSGETPAGVERVFRSETEFALAVFRTQLFGADDLENVKLIQTGYRVQPLSAFVGGPAPEAAPAIDFIKPLTPTAQRSSREFFNILSFILQFCPTHPSERDLMARFAEIGVGAGKRIDIASLSPDVRTALKQGMADAWTAFAQLKKQCLDTKEVTAGDLYGTREYLKNNYLQRMAAAGARRGRPLGLLGTPRARRAAQGLPRRRALGAPGEQPGRLRRSAQDQWRRPRRSSASGTPSSWPRSSPRWQATVSLPSGDCWLPPACAGERRSVWPGRMSTWRRVR